MSPDKYFETLDRDNDGVVSLEDFIAGCKNNEEITKAVEACLLSAISCTYPYVATPTVFSLLPICSGLQPEEERRF